MKEKILVSEIFPALQGEGRTLGRPVIFVRFYGCNLKCEWCDSKYAIEGGEHKTYTVDKIIGELNTILQDCTYGLDSIVWTGGEPLIYLNKYDIIKTARREVPLSKMEVETNGLLLERTKIEEWMSDCFQFNISPKFFDCWKEAYLTKKLKDNFQFLRNYQFKFVLENKTEKSRKDCIKNIEEFTKYHGILNNSVWIMTEGVTREEQLKNMGTDIDFCLDRGYNYTPRMHILAFDKKRKC